MDLFTKKPNKLGSTCGFGNTLGEEKARTDMMVKVIRDYDFNLFKFNRVCGQLRDEKEGAMINMMTRAGKHRPGLVLLDHRLNLGEKGLPHAITYLQPLVGLLKDKPNQKAGKTAPVPLLTDGQRVYFRQ